MWNKSCHCKGECHCGMNKQENKESTKHASKEETLHREEKGQYQGSHKKGNNKK